MNKVELLAPVGDFKCLEAAVQNGADSVYFGSSFFNARAFASNFGLEELQKAISYAKLRNVKTHLTLNTLVKEEEFSKAVEVASRAYEYGIDAIIVQDIGLARFLISHFPDLPIHASTQMTIHNLEGALACQNLGFKRVVLARELPINEIRYICEHTDIGIETFIHGALCISYSGQCLFSSMVGGRSGNRGKCAQPCRMNYDLLQKNTSGKETTIDSGYLLSPRDLCGLDYIPELIKAGVSCFKIEGRMKPPEYVAITTKIYRKYIDLALSGKEYVVDPKDKQNLLQAFNRGGFSSGHFSTSANKDLIYKEKPDNMGLLLGYVHRYNEQKGIITLTLKEPLAIGDTIMLQKEHAKYTVSELMLGKENTKEALANSTVRIGRMKGNISAGDKVYKISSKSLVASVKDSYSDKELKKIPLHCTIAIKKDMPIRMEVSTTRASGEWYQGIKVSAQADCKPVPAKNAPITVDKVIHQISKTKDTPYVFEKITVYLDENLFVPSISMLNNLRRETIEKLQRAVLQKITRKITHPFSIPATSATNSVLPPKEKKISLYLPVLDLTTDYTLLHGIDRIYLPLKYFAFRKYDSAIEKITHSFATYIYMPTIIKANYSKLIDDNIENALAKYPICGFVVSNLSCMDLLATYGSSYSFIASSGMNLFNRTSIEEIAKLGIKTITFSPELNKEDMLTMLSSPLPVSTELTCYGKARIMSTNYCLLGVTNKCYPTCGARCTSAEDTYWLKDRLGYAFRIVPDNVQTVTEIYNSKITSIDTSDLPVDFLRIDALEESVAELNTIIPILKQGKKLEGNQYTNGNFYRQV